VLLKKNILAFAILAVSAIFLITPASGSGKPKRLSWHLPLIPMPQKIEWTSQHYDIAENDKKVIQHIVDQLPGIPAHTDEA
jgi:hypothetical protein